MGRGLHPIFHGRKEELSQFEFFIDQLQEEKGRTSFLIEGPPGAGKTSLAEKCYQLAQQKGWQLVLMDIPTLLDLTSFRKRLGREPLWKFWRKRQLKLPMSWQGLNIEAKLSFQKHWIIKTLNAVDKPTLIGLDEAQMLGNQHLTSEDRKILSNVLDQLHNRRGHPKHPTVFLMNGLGRTQDILEEYGISRFAPQSVIPLNPLDKTSERKIIYDWMVDRIGFSRDDPGLSLWMDQISQQTHQWPVHITTYISQMQAYFKDQTPQCSPKALKEILNRGTQAKKRYYHRRTRRLSMKEKETMVSFLNHQQHPSEFQKEDWMAFFQKTFEKEETISIFQKALHDGCIHEQTNGCYQFSIPSMQSWLSQTFRPKPPLSLSPKETSLPTKGTIFQSGDDFYEILKTQSFLSSSKKESKVLACMAKNIQTDAIHPFEMKPTVQGMTYHQQTIQWLQEQQPR
ncbi:MAG: ATP-binding protein [Flavobacteriaceae bacterium]|nr:ATP-binding protein [Flavobacteriaceae bacterium]MCY4267657.1 ATP-binding protein [Flavobacteriaceae bacterium]